MGEEQKIVGYTFDLISVGGGKLATKQLDKPVDADWDDLDAHLAMWQMIHDTHILKADRDGKLVTLIPSNIALLQLAGYVYE
jgi:hypothetical protein